MATNATLAARLAATRRVQGAAGSARASQSDVPVRMKQTAVAGFIATASPMPRLSGSMSSHHPNRVAAPTTVTAALAPWVSVRVVTVRVRVESAVTSSPNLWLGHGGRKGQKTTRHASPPPAALHHAGDRLWARCLLRLRRSLCPGWPGEPRDPAPGRDGPGRGG